MPNAFNFSASPFDCLSPEEQALVKNSVDIAYYPEGAVVLGVGDAPVYFLLAFAAVWPILLNTAAGVAQLDKNWLLLARSTMERIACRAQVAKGTLYLYYPSKDELLRGVVEHALRHSAVYQPLRRRKGETVRAFLRRSLLPTLEAVDSSERGMLARLVLSEARHAPELARLYKELAFDAWQNYVQDLLALAVKEGELRTRSVSRSAQLLASPFWMALVHNNLLASEGSQKLALKPLVELLIDNLFAGTAGDNAAVQRQ